MASFDIQFIDSIHAIDANRWNAITGTDYPFLRHEFLAALEDSGSANTATGWQPHHLTIVQNGTVVGLLPLYLKFHSYGEYVFDWAWADAYQRHGVPYYPKLLCAIPYTPATGPRLALAKIVSDTSVSAEIVAAIAHALQTEAMRCAASSIHCLFPTAQASGMWQQQLFTQRLGCQYHWLNQGYTSFNDFLASFNARKRKNVNKERARVREQELVLVRKCGSDISFADWAQFNTFYHLTYFKRSGRQGYLNKAFFQQLAASMSEQIMMVVAQRQGITLAAALFFIGSDTLYGRYWGCNQEFEFLHFEACYYQGIEFAIERGLARFDPGAQGEHKIQRGFTPVLTYSNHWIMQPNFRAAIDDYIRREAEQTRAYTEAAQDYLPFKQTHAQQPG